MQTALLGIIVTAAVSGVIGMSWGWVKPPKWLKKHPIWAIVMVIAITVICGVAGWKLNSSLTPHVARANMTNLMDGASVPRILEVSGTAYEVPDGHQLWVANRPDGMREWYWADEGCIVRPGGGDQRTFDCWPLHLGSSEADQGSFSVYLFDVDDQAARTISDFRRDHSDDGIGMMELPAGVTMIGIVNGIKLHGQD